METIHPINILAALQSNDQKQKSLIEELSTNCAKETLQAMYGKDAKLDTSYEEKITHQKQNWENYFKETVFLLNESIPVFESYDHENHLKPLFQNIKAGKHINARTFPKYLDFMIKYAIKAFENEIWNDAYLMFYFIISYYPNDPKLYIDFGLTLEKIKGLDLASEFYKFTCELFKDPELYLAAAICEGERDNLDKTREYLLKIKEIFSKAATLNNDDQELLNVTNEVLENLEQSA